MSNRSQYSSTAEASKVVARNMELPQCEGLKACAAATSIVQFVLISNRFTYFDLTIVVQIGFGLIGFMIAAYLLRDRDLISECEVDELDGLVPFLRGFLRSLPLPQMAVVICVVLFLPQMLALESMTVPDVNEVPAIIIRMFSNYFSGFQRPDFNGRSLLLWPFMVLFMPRRLLSLVLLTVLGSGLVLQFSGLFLGSTQPASLMVNPSALDLLSAGTFLAVISRQRRIGQSEAQIGMSAIVAGLILAGGLVIARLQNQGLMTLGAFTLFSAPKGFGVINFVIEIVATTLVSSLWWRDLGGMIEGVSRAPAH